MIFLKWRNLFSSFLKKRHAAIYIVSSMFFVIFAVHLAIDIRSKAVFKQELENHAHLTVRLIEEKIKTRLQADMNSLELLAQASLNNDRNELSAANHLLGNNPHFIALGLFENSDISALHLTETDAAQGSSNGVMHTRIKDTISAHTPLEKVLYQLGTDILIVAPIPPIANTSSATGELSYIFGLTSSEKLFAAANLDLNYLMQNDSEDFLYAVRDIKNHTILGGMEEATRGERLTAPIPIAGLEWEIAARPPNGWSALPNIHSKFNIGLSLAAAVTLIPMIIAAILLAERNANITALKAREAKLLEISQRFKLAMDASNIGIWEMDALNGVCYMDERSEQLHNIRLPGQHRTLSDWMATIVPEDRPKAEAFFFNASCGSTTVSEVYRVQDSDNNIRYLRSAGSNYLKDNGDELTSGIIWDVTTDMMMAESLRQAKKISDMKNVELEKANDHIRHNALHDPLTGLANRRKLDEELQIIASNSIIADEKFTILHLDLDRFKQINDTLGHAAGDAMLVNTARVLKQNTRNGDLVARIGGDEFVILLPQNNNADDIRQVATRIIAELNQPIQFNGISCRCGVSIGIAHGEGQNIDAKAILINADIALYRAKAQGRNQHEFFTPCLQAEIVNNKRIADEILNGLEHNEFETWYQPQFCAKTYDLIGVEALIRWRHPQHGILSPHYFLKIAEDLDVISTFDRIVLQQSLQEKRLWNMAGINVQKLSVNVSARRLGDQKLIDSLADLNIEAGEVSFELLESIFLDDSDNHTIETIEQIKKYGIEIEIDDFGTGHTSIISLLHLKPKRLKIDRQLIQPIVKSKQERALVRSIIDIARSLGIDTVAEGVESQEHAAMMSQMGCNILQGYYFSEPLPACNFIEFAKQQAWRKAS